MIFARRLRAGRPAEGVADGRARAHAARRARRLARPPRAAHAAAGRDRLEPPGAGRRPVGRGARAALQQRGARGRRALPRHARRGRRRRGALRCLAAWAKGSILPWPTLAPAMDASIGATRAATELAPLQAGCDLLVAAAEADWEGDRSATSFGGARHLSAALALRPTFEAASAQAAHAAGSPHGAAPVDVAAALAGLYGSMGSCHLRRDTGERGGDAPPPAATAPEFAPLLELMLGALAHPSPEVVLPAVAILGAGRPPGRRVGAVLARRRDAAARRRAGRRVRVPARLRGARRPVGWVYREED